MARRFPLAGAAACLAAGVSLWFTRASLDVLTVGGRETRVAMLPSWPELAGLCVLVFLVAALWWPRLARSQAWPLAPAGRAAARAADLLIPLFALPWVAIPYVPWVADAVPAWRALAGPAKYGVWLIVGGLLAWIAADTFGRRAHARRPGMSAQLLLICVLSAAAYATAAYGLARAPLRADSDEPQRLLVTQSLLTDGDLDIGNNHARGDYREYVAGPMEAHAAPGRDGAIYSLHAVGLPLLLVPAFAAGGRTGVTIALVAIGTLAAALLWRTTARHTASTRARVLAWLAVGVSAPWVLYTHAVHPGVPAALAIMLAAATSTGFWTAAARGAALAVLPWLGAQYAPLSLALLGLFSWRAARSPATLVALVAPWLASLAGWLYFVHALWGSWSPVAPPGGMHGLEITRLLAGTGALFMDQEAGVLPYAPALLLALPGLWQLWQDGGTSRQRAIDTCVAVGVLAATVGSHQIWWGTHAAPGGGLVAVVPLLALPIARWADAAQTALPRLALGRALVLAGLAITAAMVFGGDGLLARGSEGGSSALLEWLAPGRELVRAAPSAAVLGESGWLFAIPVAAWALAATLCAWAARRLPLGAPGASAAVAVSLVVAAVGVTASVVSYGLGARVPAPGPSAARGESPLLHEFDARRRPIAVVYDPWRLVRPEQVLEHVSFDAAPGLRRRPQPVRVLLNMRLLLPAGRYRLTVEAASGSVAAGPIGLQVGVMGGPLREWSMQAAPGRPWQQEFDLPVDARFVGFRVAPDLERHVAAARVEPLAIVNVSDRPARPPVLAAARYGETDVLFHGTAVYPEAKGFWVRGNASLPLSIALPADRTGAPGIRLSVHSGARENRVDLATSTWHATLPLEPGVARQIVVPAFPGQRVVPVRVSTESGFVPAETQGGNDRRLLGCWVEVLP